MAWTPVTYYSGPNHYHWQYYYWSKQFGTYLYHDPALPTPFYYSVKDERYYPITHNPHGYTHEEQQAAADEADDDEG